MSTDHQPSALPPALLDWLGKLATGELPEPPPELGDAPELEALRTYLSDVSQFSLDVSSGNLSTNIRHKGRLAGSLKNLHAGLRHLIWQTTAIARGDFTQRVDFMGDFSSAFNAMVQDLQQARAQLLETNGKLQQTNEALSKANAMRDKMFSIIGHDLRNPIGGAATLLELLTTEPCPLDQAEQAGALKALRGSCQSAYLLLENLLSWARNQLGEVEPHPECVSLGSVVAEICNLIRSSAAAKQVTIHTRVDDGLVAYADRDMLGTILRNLAGNALKFTPPGGRIEILADQPEADKVRVCVADNGVGIPPENLAKLFRDDESFTTYGTNSEKGSGLGLNLCREFVEHNGGTIRVESEPGAGSRFYFTLPSTS